MLIVGAGLSGLIAAQLMPDSVIIEAGPARDTSQHRALLRFRSSAVGDAIGIQFRPVTVYKGIYHNGQFVKPNIRLANWYSMKVVGGYADRSIWKTEPVERWIAPEDLYERLLKRCASRIAWNQTFDAARLRLHEAAAEPIICTTPLDVTLNAAGMKPPAAIRFAHAGIVVKRWRLANARVYQTIYFPSSMTPLYRASITGNLLIAEYVNGQYSLDDSRFSHNEMFDAFGISAGEADPIDIAQQKYGKIAPIDDAWRREAIFQLSQQRHIYSLGRFATWRNILLDDVLKDISVIKRLLEGDSYTRARHLGD